MAFRTAAIELGHIYADPLAAPIQQVVLLLLGHVTLANMQTRTRADGPDVPLVLLANIKSVVTEAVRAHAADLESVFQLQRCLFGVARHLDRECGKKDTGLCARIDLVLDQTCAMLETCFAEPIHGTLEGNLRIRGLCLAAEVRAERAVRAAHTHTPAWQRNVELCRSNFRAAIDCSTGSVRSQTMMHFARTLVRLRNVSGHQRVPVCA